MRLRSWGIHYCRHARGASIASERLKTERKFFMMSECETAKRKIGKAINTGRNGGLDRFWEQL
jgi:hypothetical protein